MPNPRTPTAKAKITGTARKNPKRFAQRAEPNGVPLGEPSDWMGGEQRVAWAAFTKEFPWLNESDRTLVEIASCLRARLMSGEEVGVQALGQLRMCVSAMGGTPADRSKVMVPDGEEADPSERFFN